MAKEREQLEADREETLAQMGERLQAEVVSSTEEMEKKHAYRMEQTRQELAEKHEQVGGTRSVHSSTFLFSISA